MLTSLIRFAFISFLFSSATVFSADNTTNSSAQNTSQALLNTQLFEWIRADLQSIKHDLDRLSSVSGNDVSDLDKRISAIESALELREKHIDDKLATQGKYVETINASVDRFGILASILGLVASIIAVMFGWISAGRKAKSEAKKHVEDWLESNKKELDTQLAAAKEKAKESLEGTLETEITSAKQQIEELINSSKEKIETVETRVDSMTSEVTDRVMSFLGEYNLNNITEEERQDVEDNASEVLTKPEEERTAADWKLLAVKAYFNESLNAALSFINRSLMEQELLPDTEIADSLFLKGVILGQLNRSEETIAVYDEMFERFKASKEVGLQEQVAKALFNKGITLGQLNRSEEAIAVYDEVFERCKGSKEVGLQEQVAKALVNKAELVMATQGKEQAKESIRDAIFHMKDGFKVQRAVMEMLSFIVESSTVDRVLACIDAISDEEINQNFDPIRSVIEKLASPRKEQVEAFARFFEDHKDKAKLKAELDEIPKG